eukprot:TRINITY_DN26405_c0_g1_i1.p1 TRINITY_DN26405_c0_g1~~TRINITY_DN26405_c0_g1_i1.p1  ORF type:complete len:156 (-),score=28.79 TRINITY_DN26405_c0_g1_i1:161-628(-)
MCMKHGDDFDTSSSSDEGPDEEAGVDCWLCWCCVPKLEISGTLSHREEARWAKNQRRRQQHWNEERAAAVPEEEPEQVYSAVVPAWTGARYPRNTLQRIGRLPPLSPAPPLSTSGLPRRERYGEARIAPRPTLLELCPIRDPAALPGSPTSGGGL